MKSLAATTYTTQVIHCKHEALSALVEEYNDWRDNGLTVIAQGTTEKKQCGFIVLCWWKPVPPPFQQKLHWDSDVLDCFTLANTMTSTIITRTPPQL